MIKLFFIYSNLNRLKLIKKLKYFESFPKSNPSTSFTPNATEFFTKINIGSYDGLIYKYVSKLERGKA